MKRMEEEAGGGRMKFFPVFLLLLPLGGIDPMFGTRLRHVVLSVAMLVGLTAVGVGCHGPHSSAPVYYDIEFEVHNRHGEPIAVEGVDSSGHLHYFGTVYPGETVDFIVGDYWTGRRLMARCEVFEDVVESEYAYDGLHWDVY